MRHHLILRVVTKLLVGAIMLFAFYVQFHGDFSPGGGFQAGVIMAVALSSMASSSAYKMCKKFSRLGWYTNWWRSACLSMRVPE